MKKSRHEAIFKTCNPNQMMVLPPSLGELVPVDHIVRVIERSVDEMDLSILYSPYKGGGTSSYDPKMMLKVLVYGYVMKIYTGRKIAKALRQDITFMYISGMNKPDFRTINLFRSGVLKKTIEDVFSSMLAFLKEKKYIRYENYFVDGTDIQADANKHKVVWSKNSKRYKALSEDKLKELFTKIDQMNEEEDRLYGDHDLEETGSNGPITQEQIRAYAEKANKILQKTPPHKERQKVEKVKRDLQQQQTKLDKYQHQLDLCGERSGYSITDSDATVMRTKTDNLLPSYNVMIGTEDQMIVNYSIHQNPSDTANLISHLEQLEKHTDEVPKNMMGDSAFGSEENYDALEKKEINNYLKYNTFHKEQTRKHKQNKFHKDNFPYDSQKDCYICPNNKCLFFSHQVQKKTKSGYTIDLRIYECESCEKCPFANECKKSEKNRTIQFSLRFEYFKKQARDNLNSEKGIKLRKQRGIEDESVFGDIKRNQAFNRFHLRGKEKVNAEFGLVAIAHNLKKIHLKLGNKAA
jgi:transposase